ncbi:hypothetical protein PsYK624_106820 [Phanerochaete sordida]|uniref:Uncharacterized protein n=1 Tax=Phanerochaete sordida TaxID=48140 RepID=A0A9P3LHU6_9APHY|nr:hypothetical protein PsYK624_106820 [Phanerochaete sordida]
MVAQNTNARAEATDNAEYRPDIGDVQPIGERGAEDQSALFEKEDTETAQSDATGRIPKGEVDDLLSNASDITDVSGRTRGKKVDAWKQDREMDQSLKETGVADEE